MQALRADLATRKTCFRKDLCDLLSLLFGILGDRIGLCLLDCLLLHLREFLLKGYAAFITIRLVLSSCSLLRISGTLALPN